MKYAIKQAAELYRETESLDVVASELDLSPATVSRYIAVSKLGDDVVTQVESGSLSITAALATRKARVARLTDQEVNFLEIAFYLGYFTRAQMAEYMGATQASLYPKLTKMCDTGLLSSQNVFGTLIYRVGPSGSNYLGVSYERNWVSASAIHQRIMRNQIALIMRQKNQTATFLSRQQCWEIGFNPAHSEHLVSFVHDGGKKFALVIIDDHNKRPARVVHSVKREHDKNRALVKGDIVLAWKDLVSEVYAYTTDERRLPRLKRYISQVNDLPIPIYYRHIQPFFEVY